MTIIFLYDFNPTRPPKLDSDTEIIPHDSRRKKKEQQAISYASIMHFLVICHNTEDLRPFVTTVLNLAVCCGLMEAARFFCTQVKST